MRASQWWFTPLIAVPSSMNIPATSFAEPRRYKIGRKLFRPSIVLLICPSRALRSYIWTWVGNLHVDNNHDSLPRRRSRSVILEFHRGVPPWNWLKYPEHTWNDRGKDQLTFGSLLCLRYQVIPKIVELDGDFTQRVVLWIMCKTDLPSQRMLPVYLDI